MSGSLVGGTPQKCRGIGLMIMRIEEVVFPWALGVKKDVLFGVF